MIVIKVIRNKDGVAFERRFDSAKEARRFYQRCKRGSSLSIWTVKGCEDDEEMRYVCGEC